MSAQLLALLAEHPDGLTALETATLVQRNPQSVGSVLSKMFLYGQIGRRRDPARTSCPLVYFRRPQS